VPASRKTTFEGAGKLERSLRINERKNEESNLNSGTLKRPGVNIDE
jgi:hypothetical protein